MNRIIKYSVIVLVTFLLAWGGPYLYHLVADKASKNVFAYYSSIEKSFCAIEYDDIKNKVIRRNIRSGREYTEEEFDSILPMFYYRQLLADGRMPDSIDGVAISPQAIGRSSFFFRYEPKYKNKPHIPIYTLLESMSGRVELKMPGDVFRIKNNIEFVVPESNSVDKAKSNLFMKSFVKRGGHFPAKLVAGNPSIRKEYDEGYFILDSNDKLFHLKMVNGKPFLKNIDMPSDIKPVYISTMEPQDRSFYAFVFDAQNRLYLISTDKYKMIEIPCPKFEIDNDKIIIMANPLYWNISVISDQGKDMFAINADSKEIVDTMSFIDAKGSVSIAGYIFPFEIGFKSYKSEYVMPIMQLGLSKVLFVNIFLVLVLFAIKKIKRHKIELIPSIWVALTGIFGFVPILILDR